MHQIPKSFPHYLAASATFNRTLFRYKHIAQHIRLVSKTSTNTNTNTPYLNPMNFNPHNSTFTDNSTSSSNPNDTDVADIANQVQYLKTLPKSQLFSLFCIGLVTTRSSFLNLVIKIFPYLPMWVIKFFVSKLYVGGNTINEVKKTALELRERGISNMMLSLTIEDSEGLNASINVNKIIDQTIKSIHEVLKVNIVEQIEDCKSSGKNINDIAPGYIALKASALVPNSNDILFHFNNPMYKEKRQELIKNVDTITNEVFMLNQKLGKLYPQRKAPFLVSTIDAEKYDLQKNGVYELQRIMFQKYNKAEYRLTSVVGTWQLYLKDSASDILKEEELARKGNYKLGLKLVRGAYIHSEPNRNVIFDTKSDTDKNYDRVTLSVMDDMIKNSSNSAYGHLMIASHNQKSQLAATELLQKPNTNEFTKTNVIMGQLLGMADMLTYELIKKHNVQNIIKYVPWGPPVETKDYLLRRLQENGDAVRTENGWPLVKAIVKTVFSP
ncbi:hypothetical protein TPHA_0C00660 [Tetrapisispora phaffii CBS 4417]|uniref:Proline dehydrogenase n=1 Tax=Tetrapisispora phaffii (strain ATCC 24235 / CBS 4417 / NBRC 1672 / NRRL Y-8282 / UCD 70-5) TaxID=1071381 RepID=G8BR47_TETPH|nr:hypothetical protein TPHA_0C00660 [Tetrapisispora phaffii CBS 4417]CCE62223.1 hypothetical protein TPHA_0C00660 [Tetrapisispora phaffii CBS 4417]